MTCTWKFLWSGDYNCALSGTPCYEFQRLYGMYSGRFQGNGTGNPDPYFCMDLKEYDGQPGRC